MSARGGGGKSTHRNSSDSSTWEVTFNPAMVMSGKAENTSAAASGSLCWGGCTHVRPPHKKHSHHSSKAGARVQAHKPTRTHSGARTCTYTGTSTCTPCTHSQPCARLPSWGGPHSTTATQQKPRAGPTATDGSHPRAREGPPTHHVRLRVRRLVPHTVHGAAHEHQPARVGGKGRVKGDGRAQVNQRAQCYQCDLPGLGGTRGHQVLGGAGPGVRQWGQGRFKGQRDAADSWARAGKVARGRGGGQGGTQAQNRQICRTWHAKGPLYSLRRPHARTSFTMNLLPRMAMVLRAHRLRGGEHSEDTQPLWRWLAAGSEALGQRQPRHPPPFPLHTHSRST